MLDKILKELAKQVIEQMQEQSPAKRPPPGPPRGNARETMRRPPGNRPRSLQELRGAAKPARVNSPLDAEVIEATAVTPARSVESVADHVSRHLDSSAIASHASQLGDSVAREQQQLSQHVSQALGSGPQGNLARGRATGGETVVAQLADSESVAAQIARSLSSPQQIRTAFILGEILKRPEF